MILNRPHILIAFGLILIALTPLKAQQGPASTDPTSPYYSGGAKPPSNSPANPNDPTSPFYNGGPVPTQTPTRTLVPSINVPRGPLSPATPTPRPKRSPTPRPFSNLGRTSPYYQGPGAPVLHPMNPMMGVSPGPTPTPQPYHPETSNPANPNDPTSPFYNPQAKK